MMTPALRMNPDFRQHSVNIHKSDVFILPVDINRNSFCGQQFCHIRIQIPAAVDMDDPGRIGVSAFHHEGLTFIRTYIRLGNAPDDFRLDAVPAVISPAKQCPPAQVQSEEDKAEEQENESQASEDGLENDTAYRIIPFGFQLPDQKRNQCKKRPDRGEDKTDNSFRCPAHLLFH